VASLSVRQLDDETISRLRIRAAENGVSMEEEARRILRQSVSTPVKVGELAQALFGKKHGVELELTAREPHLPHDFAK
jgi:plasmid stability protein